ncbi:MAG: phosphoribosyltransferase [Actinomycetia bacterium]|nr:phosphoribosyltransferase [Actinomycetes bacterium]
MTALGPPDTIGPMTPHVHGYPVEIGSQTIELPLVPVAEGAAIALLMTIDRGVSFMARAGADLAELLRDAAPEVVATNATLGIPVAIEVSRALGLDDYLVLQKTPKIHLADALVAPLRSITTAAEQALRLDRARLPLVAGRRVVLVDDVAATGGSLVAALRLLRQAGAEVVAIGVLLVEGTAWEVALGDDAHLVRSLGRLPGFRRVAGGWDEVWG